MSHALIFTYTPQGITEKDWGRIQSFVTDIAEKIVDDRACEQAIRKTLFAVSYLTDFFANRHFYPLTAEDILNEDSIEFFVSECLTHRSPHAQATVRSQLRAIGRVVNSKWRGRAEERAYATTVKGAPYTDHEVERLRWWAESQSGEYRKQSARSYLALTLGAGLRTKEVVTLTAVDVTVDGSGVVVHPHGYRGAAPR